MKLHDHVSDGAVTFEKLCTLYASRAATWNPNLPTEFGSLVRPGASAPSSRGLGLVQVDSTSEGHGKLELA